VVERSLAGQSRELLLILAKAFQFSWDTVEALLFLGAPHFTISNHELDVLRDQFTSLHVSSSQEILAHYRDRKTLISSSGPRRLPELHTS
jgi:hypothetical protein